MSSVEICRGRGFYLFQWGVVCCQHQTIILGFTYPVFLVQQGPVHLPAQCCRFAITNAANWPQAKKQKTKRIRRNERTNPIVMQYRAMDVNANKWSYPLVICGLYSLVSKFVATSEFHRWRFLFHMNNTSSQQCHQNSWINSSNEVVRKKHTNGLCINNCNNLTNPYKSLHNTTTDRSEQTKSIATNWLVDYRPSDELATWLTD